MSNGHGGPRTPHNPAPVSGPGRLAKRTDGGPSQKIMVPTDQPYGDREALVAQEKSAGMAQSPSITAANIPSGNAADQGQPYGGGEFGAPTNEPHIPITNGVDIGPGAGSSALGTPPGQRPTGQLTNMLAQLSSTDTTGTLAKLYELAKQRGV